jgi:hypothetical protein
MRNQRYADKNLLATLLRIMVVLYLCRGAYLLQLQRSTVGRHARSLNRPVESAIEHGYSALTRSAFQRPGQQACATSLSGCRDTLTADRDRLGFKAARCRRERKPTHPYGPLCARRDDGRRMPYCRPATTPEAETLAFAMQHFANARPKSRLSLFFQVIRDLRHVPILMLQCTQ